VKEPSLSAGRRQLERAVIGRRRLVITLQAYEQIGTAAYSR
jgi:hypothetical protein